MLMQASVLLVVWRESLFSLDFHADVQADSTGDGRFVGTLF